MPQPVAQEVPRPALDTRLDTCSKHRLTIVSAGPGWGKTTAVARWARRSAADVPMATAWLTLNADDNTLTLFWDAVLRAIAHSGAIPADHPLSAATTAAGVNEQVLQALFRGIRELPQPVLLILDDFHVIEDPAIVESLANLVAYDSPINLMVLTRWDPALPLHRLRVGGDLAEVRASDLAFDIDAVVRLAGRTDALELTSEQVATILARTEGWAAGVRLVITYLARERDDATLEHFSGTERSVAEYLLAEVLAHLDTEARDFLLRTSVVEWLSGELAEALVPGSHGLARLEMLEHASSFVTCIDRDRSIYRVHPLLRDILVHRLRRDDAAGYRQANRAAARWLDGADESIAALGHAVAAEDWQLAGEIFLNAAPWIITGHRFTVVRHLRAIPYSRLPSSAALELCAAGAELIAGRYDALTARVESARTRIRDGDVLPPLGSALIEVFAAVAAREAGDPQRAMDAATAALTYLAQSPPSGAAERLRPIAVHQRTVGYVMVTGDVALAQDMFSEVVDLQLGETTLVSFNARAYRAWCLTLAGRLDEGERAGSELLREAVALGWTSTLQALPLHLTLAVIHHLRGEEPEAYAATMAGLAVAAAGVTELWPNVALHLIRSATAVALGRPRAALASFERAIAERGPRPVPRVLTDLWLRTHTDVALLVGEGPVIRPPLQEAGTEGRSATWWSSSARIALARSDLGAADAAACEVLHHFGADESAATLADTLATIEAQLVLAVVADRRRRPHESAVCIRAALERARSQRIVPPFLAVDPGRTAGVLQRALTDRVVHADEFLKVVLPRLDPKAVPAHEPDPLIEPLTERELVVLNELPSWKSNAEIAAELYVSVNTVKTHVQHVFRKLNVPNRRQAVLRARDLGLIS